MVKEKINSVRIYDKDGFRLRAACICVRSEVRAHLDSGRSNVIKYLYPNQQAEAEVLLVTSSRRPELWIVPGGGVEPDEETSATAVREVLEEAGVVGALGRCLGVFEVSGEIDTRRLPVANQPSLLCDLQNREHKHRTKVFVMVVTEELADWEDSRQIGRRRQWFTVDSALEQLGRHKPVQRHYILQLRYSKKLGRNLSNCLSGDDSIFQHDDDAEFLRHDAELKSINSNEDGGGETLDSGGCTRTETDAATTITEGDADGGGDGGGGGGLD